MVITFSVVGSLFLAGSVIVFLAYLTQKISHLLEEKNQLEKEISSHEIKKERLLSQIESLELIYQADLKRAETLRAETLKPSLLNKACTFAGNASKAVSACNGILAFSTTVMGTYIGPYMCEQFSSNPTFHETFCPA
jgi:hypothetical protein